MEHQKNERILRLKEVIDRTGLSRSTIYALLAEKKFPSRVNLGSRAIGWRETDISMWISKLNSKN